MDKEFLFVIKLKSGFTILCKKMHTENGFVIIADVFHTIRSHPDKFKWPLQGTTTFIPATEIESMQRSYADPKNASEETEETEE